MMDNLPNEIVQKIQSYLSLDQKKLTRGTSHHWRALIDDQLIFNIELDDTSREFVKKCRGIIRKLTVGNLSFPVTLINPPHTILFTNSNVNVNTEMLYLHNTGIHQLHFASGSIPRVSRRRLQLPNLVAIKVNLIEAENTAEFDRVMVVSKMCLPYLSNVELRASEFSSDPDLFLRFYQFLTNVQSSKLKSFTVEHPQRALNVSVMETEVRNSEAIRIREKFQNLKLEELTLILSQHEDYTRTNPVFSLGIELLYSQVNLTYLELCLMNHEITEETDPINEIIMRNSETLKSLQLYSKTNLQVLYYYNCPAIGHCSHLEDLQLSNYVFQLSRLNFPQSLKRLSLSGWASMQGDFELLRWIATNMESLVYLEMLLNWNHYLTITTCQVWSLTAVSSMPNLRTAQFRNSTAPVFKQYFGSRDDVIPREYKTVGSPYDSFPKLYDVLDVTFKRG